MTDITGTLQDVSGEPANGTISVRAVAPRTGDNPTEIVTEAWRDFHITAGAFAMTGLDPGPAEVRIRTWRWRQTWKIEIPDSATPVTLWPLVDAGVPAPSPNSGFVRSNEITHQTVLTQSQYAALPTPDPSTLYIITESA
ncbi:phage upper tail fiber protein [Tomitella gaofuii]|uniref:phage upper tail fiber protein n=1 Tax=Tomitella gaofuii TaxID=2760083 RepID=UPI0015FB9854|nr:hypothetical protein [Tomitella gaofuii]